MMLERLVARSYDALNRRDLPAIMSTWADDAVFEFPGKSAISGRVVGKPAIEAWWRRWCDRLESVHFTVKHAAFANPVMLNLANTVFVEWEVEARTRDGVAGRAEGVSVMRLRRGKAVFVRDYIFDPTIEEVIWGAAEPATATEMPPLEERVPVGARQR